VKIGIPGTVPSAASDEPHAQQHHDLHWPVVGIVIGYVWPSSDVAGRTWPAWGADQALADTFLRMIKMIMRRCCSRRWSSALRHGRPQVDGGSGSGDHLLRSRNDHRLFLAWACEFLPARRRRAGARDVHRLAEGGAEHPGAHGLDMLVTLFPTSWSTPWRRRHPPARRLLDLLRDRPRGRRERARPCSTCSRARAVMFKFTGYVMKFAPIGVMAAISPRRQDGLGILFTLGKLVLLMYGGLIVFAVIVIAACPDHPVRS